MRALLFAIVGILSGSGPAQNGPDIVISGDSAYILANADVISEGAVQNFDWSRDGQILIYTRIEPPTPAEILTAITSLKPLITKKSVMAWRVGTKTPRLLWRLPSADRAEATVNWLSGTHTVLITTETSSIDRKNPRIELVRANAETGEALPLVTESPGGIGWIDVYPSPLQPVAIASIAPDTSGTWHVRVVREHGSASTPVDTGTLGAFVRWDTTGRPVLTTYISGEAGTGRAIRKDMLFDLESLTFSAIDGALPPMYSNSDNNWPFDIEIEDRVLITAELRRTSKNAWITAKDKSRRTQAFVAADVGQAGLSPKLDFVAYTVQGTLLVRPILKTKATDVDAVLDAAERAELVERAKQVGLSALMYAGDHNDTLPGSTSNVTAMFLPYSKNSGIYDGFVYTFGGGALQDVDNINQTEMGYMPGKGGRAVIYIDGHARWIPDK